MTGMEIEGYAKVLDRMRTLCSRREYCSTDILKKASACFSKYQGAGDPIAGATSVLESLKNDGYVDDLRYSEAFAREKAGISGWGIVKIRYALSLKGIDKEVISEALLSIDADTADARMERLLAGKYRSLKDDPQCRMKLLRFALGRGYAYDEASSVIERIIKI